MYFQVKNKNKKILQMFQTQNLNNVETTGRNYSGTRNNKVCMKTWMIKSSSDPEPKRVSESDQVCQEMGMR